MNTDPGAAIFHVADCGVVAGLFDVADELTELLGDWASEGGERALDQRGQLRDLELGADDLGGVEYIARS